MSSDQSYPVSSQATVTKWFKLALFNFLLAASIGVLLRFAFVNEIKWLNYKSFQNAHSTLALLGWGYLGFFALILGSFATPQIISKRIYRILFWLSFTVIFLACISFVALEGRIIPYLFIVAFSILVFVFVFNFLKDTRGTYPNRLSYRFIQVALFLLCLSFAGSYIAVVSILVSGAKKILLYYISSQFFLHFQYNGWFTFALLGLFIKLCEEKGIKLDEKKNKTIFIALIAGVFITYFISIFWGNQTKLWLLGIASIGGLVQLTPVILYRKYLAGLVSSLSASLNKHFKLLVFISLACFVLKLIMQVIIIIPDIATLAFTIRNYVIAYIHLVFIGMTSLFLFAWAIEHNYITVAKTVRLGVYSLVMGFILVELMLFIQGTLLWMGKGFITFYYPLLFLVSVLLPLGLLIITIRNLKYLPFKKQLS